MKDKMNEESEIGNESSIINKHNNINTIGEGHKFSESLLL